MSENGKRPAEAFSSSAKKRLGDSLAEERLHESKEKAYGKMELYLDKLERDVRNIPLVDSNRLKEIREIQGHYEKSYESILSELFALDKNTTTMLHKTIEGMRQLMRLENNYFIKVAEKLAAEKTDYFVYVKEANIEMTQLRNKLNMYLSSGVQSESKAKTQLIEYLQTTQGKESAANNDDLFEGGVPRQPAGEAISEGDKTPVKEDSKTLSNISKTLKKIYDSMKTYAKNAVEIEPEEKMPKYDPTTLASDMNQSIIEIKRKTIAEVLRRIQEKKPKTCESWTQTEKKKTQSFLQAENAYLTRQKEQKEKIASLEGQLEKVVNEERKTSISLINILNTQARNIYQLGQCTQAAKQEADVIESHPEQIVTSVAEMKEQLLNVEECSSDLGSAFHAVLSILQADTRNRESPERSANAKSERTSLYERAPVRVAKGRFEARKNEKKIVKAQVYDKCVMTNRIRKTAEAVQTDSDSAAKASVADCEVQVYMQEDEKDAMLSGKNQGLNGAITSITVSNPQGTMPGENDQLLFSSKDLPEISEESSSVAAADFFANTHGMSPSSVLKTNYPKK